MNAPMNVTENAASTRPVCFTYNHVKKTIVGTDVNFEKAGNPYNAQYYELMARMAAQPTYTLAPIPTEKKVKRTYSGLSRELMFDYLTLYGEQDLLDKLNQMKNESVGFPAIKSWFLENYPKFDVAKAKKEIRAGRLKVTKVKYKATKKPASTPTLTLPVKESA